MFFRKHFISKTLSLSVCESFFNCFVFSKYFFENTYFEKLSRTLNQGRLRKDFFENTYFEKLSRTLNQGRLRKDCFEITYEEHFRNHTFWVFAKIFHTGMFSIKLLSRTHLGIFSKILLMYVCEIIPLIPDFRNHA